MKKSIWMLTALFMFFLSACSVDASDSNSNKPTNPETEYPSNPEYKGTDNPGGGDGGSGGNMTINDICCGAQCYGGCKGVYLYDCGGELFYSNITGTYASANPQDLYAFFDENCPSELSEVPWWDNCPLGAVTQCEEESSSYSGGGNSYCKQMGCGGIFCSGDCIGCPGC